MATNEDERCEMREIEFKVYNEDNKFIGREFLLGDGRWAFSLESENIDRIGTLTPELNEKLFRVQCTGLKDKNGVKIFEGDVLKQCNGSINGTKWMDKNYEVKCLPKGFNLPFFMWKDDGENNMDSTHWCEVIGNKFENPELLSVE